MNEQRKSPWLGWTLIVIGAALGAGAGLFMLRPPPLGPGGGEDLHAAADLLHARIDQSLQSRAHALEPRATEAANLPELLSALDLGADARTFQDLLDNEDWWAPFRSELALSAVITTSGVLAKQGPELADPANLDVVRQARSVGTASAVVDVGGHPFIVAAARAPKGKRRAPGTVLLIGTRLERATFQSLADGIGAAVGLSDGRSVLEAGGPEALRSSLARLVAKPPRGPIALEPGRAGAAWALDGSLSLLVVFPVAVATPLAPAGTGMALGLAGAVLGLGGILSLLLRGKARAPVPTTSPSALPPTAPGAFPQMPTTGVSGIPIHVSSPGFETSPGVLSQPITAGGQVAVEHSGGMSAAIVAHQRQTDSGLAPAIMGRYHLLERVGEGGMAEIFIAATHGVEGFVRHFVVKRMHPHLARNREAVNQFIDEARLQSGIIHSNIVPVFDFGMAGDEYFMALEYIHGRDLERMVRRHIEKFGRALSLPVAYYIMHDVLEALAYAHSMTDDAGQSLQIVHRDVSPGNVLVSFRGEVKLTDFGIAKATWRVSKTELGLVKGNTSFMSPEQARGEPVDARSDLFSAGVVLYYCITGQFLYGEDDAVFKRLMRAAAGPSAADLIQMEKVPPAAASVLRRALASDPNERYQTAREFARDLAGYFTSGRSELSDLMSTLFPDRRREAR
jgi:tRNA A-37 threonylcarbamoyl transferase component Bud32